MGLPAVQNDFIGSFLLFRFGGVAAMVLAMIQLGYAGQLFQAGRKSLEWGRLPGNFRRRQTGYILHLILYGLAWMHITQWVISWGNALGLLPVMGQPMTWISSAKSHIMFFALPTLGLGMIAIQIREE